MLWQHTALNSPASFLSKLGLHLLLHLLFFSGILPCYCYHPHAHLAIVLKLCSLHSPENTSKFRRDKHPSHWHLSLATLHPCRYHRWSECHCPYVIALMSLPLCWLLLTCFSELNQLTTPNIFAAMWRFAPVPFCYSCIMLQCFWLAYYAQQPSQAASDNCVVYSTTLWL